jgi:hypothetical protein
MKTDGGVNIGMGFGQGNGSPAGLKIGANRDDPGNARLHGPQDNVLAVGIEVRKIEVAVGVDKHSLINVPQEKGGERRVFACEQENKFFPLPKGRR